jgi:hypothetical protein
MGILIIKSEFYSDGIPILFPSFTDYLDDDSNYWAIKPSVMRNICNKNTDVSKKDALEIIKKLQEWGFKPEECSHSSHINRFVINANKPNEVYSSVLNPDVIQFWEEQS